MADAAVAGHQRQSCYFIGIGGTGAKCAEAMIHLAAAGLGPDRCTMMLVDQDEPNGNGERCLRLLDNYVRLRRELRDPAAGEVPAGPALFRTDIVTPQGGATWCPSSQHGVTLGEICQLRSAAGRAESPDGLPLPPGGTRAGSSAEGFRAHPSVGAVLLSQTLEGEQFWQKIQLDPRSARGREHQGYPAGLDFRRHRGRRVSDDRALDTPRYRGAREQEGGCRRRVDAAVFFVPRAAGRERQTPARTPAPSSNRRTAP